MMGACRLKAVADISISNVDKKTSDGELPVALCNYTDVYYNARITADLSFMEATATTDQIRNFSLQRGDLLVTKDSETAEDIAVPALVSEDLVGVLCGYHLALVRPHRSLVDSRYLFWVLTSSPSRDHCRIAATGVTRYGLRADSLGNLMVPLPGLPTQKAIADFLDRETERFDALIIKKSSLKMLCQDRARVVIDNILWRLDAEPPRRSIPLKRIAKRIDVGIAEAATHAYASDGVPLIRSTNIRANEIDTSELLFIESWFADRNRRKYILSGDVLTVRTGNPGISAVVPDSLNMSQCFTQLITTVRSPHVPRFVSYALNSSPAREYFGAVGWGSAQANISVPLLAEAPIPTAAPSEQAAAAAAIDHIVIGTADLVSHLDRQVALLLERRQALITSAVTGQLDISAAA